MLSTQMQQDASFFPPATGPAHPSERQRPTAQWGTILSDVCRATTDYTPECLWCPSGTLYRYKRTQRYAKVTKQSYVAVETHKAPGCPQHRKKTKGETLICNSQGQSKKWGAARHKEEIYFSSGWKKKKTATGIMRENPIKHAVSMFITNTLRRALACPCPNNTMDVMLALYEWKMKRGNHEYMSGGWLHLLQCRLCVFL